MSAPKRASRLFIETHDQWEAVCSGPRLEILTTLEALGPSSIAEIAVWIDRPPDTLYHHVRRLERAAIVRQIDSRKVGRHVEAVFDLAADELDFDIDIEAGRNLDRLERILKAHLKRAERLFVAAANARMIDFGDESGTRNAHLRGRQAWLTPEDLVEVNELVARLRAVFDRGRAPGQGELHAYTIVMSPIHRSRPADARPTRRQRRLAAEVADRAGSEEQSE